MHFPMRCLRSDSQRAGRAAVMLALGGAVEVNEAWDGGNVAWRKGVYGSLKQCGFIRGRGIIVVWKMVEQGLEERLSI